MLNKRTKTMVGIMCVILGAAILAAPVISAKRSGAVTAFSAAEGGTLIVDPGHGGADGGAVSPGGAYESDINLAVALKLEQLAAFSGVCPVLTRETAEIDYPDEADTIRKKKVYDQRSRVELIDSVPGAVVISVHQNNYTDSSPSGAQIFFAGTEGSDILAEYMRCAVSESIGADSVRGSKQISSDIYLMNSISCPAVLIECGFLSNPGDEALLLTESYQLRLAVGMAAGFMRYISDNTDHGGTNES